MRKVLLVDDERMIVEGISKVVNWQKAGTELIGTARSGAEAFERICVETPDIVISDIAMPVMDGLQLVEKAHKDFPGVRFILLSGYQDFDYARRAMQYGVKHYLVKPCSEQQIEAALAEVAKECDEEEAKLRSAAEAESELVKVLPQVKEQFFKELITNRTYGGTELAYYEKLFGLPLLGRSVRLICFMAEGEHRHEHLFALQNIARDLLERLLLGTVIDGRLLLLTEDCGEEQLDSVRRIRETFAGYYKLPVTTVLSECAPILEIRRLYEQTLEALEKRFYLGEGSLIAAEGSDAETDDPSASSPLSCSSGQFATLVESGEREGVEREIEELFDHIRQSRLSVSQARALLVRRYEAVCRIAAAEERASYLDRLGDFAEPDTLAGLRRVFEQPVLELTERFSRLQLERHSSAVNRLIEIVAERYRDPELNLTSIARDLLYMNPDYLGKMFKKVTGEKFSAYLNRYRIERAAEHIRLTGSVKIFELAAENGFGDNPQYFSQVFKKTLGVTPSEYRKNLG